VLTPFDVQRKKREIEAKIKASGVIAPLSRDTLTIQLYEEVLREISRGSIDPKSLAYTALKPVEKDS